MTKSKEVIVRVSGRQPRLEGLKAGTVLVRPFKGTDIKVKVTAAGFIPSNTGNKVLDGETFTSLSKIAGTIMGASTNGPLWFGLRRAAETPAAPRATVEKTAKAQAIPKGRVVKAAVAEATK